MGGKKAGAGHLASRVKKIMQKDEDVGKIAQATPVLICRAMELLLKKICERTFEVASARQAKTINTSHVKSCVMSDEMLDFLKETVASAPDLAPEEAQTAKAAPKRRRAAGGDDSDGSPSEKPKKPRAPRGSKQKKEQQDGDGDSPVPTPKRRGRKKAQAEDATAPQGDEAEADVAQLGDMPSEAHAEAGHELDAAGAVLGAGVPAVPVSSPVAAEPKAGKLSLRSKHPLSLKPGQARKASTAAKEESQPQQQQLGAEAEVKGEGAEGSNEPGEQAAPAEHLLPVLPQIPALLPGSGPTLGGDYDDDYDA